MIVVRRIISTCVNHDCFGFLTLHMKDRTATPQLSKLSLINEKIETKQISSTAKPVLQTVIEMKLHHIASNTGACLYLWLLQNWCPTLGYQYCVDWFSLSTNVKWWHSCFLVITPKCLGNTYRSGGKVKTAQYHKVSAFISAHIHKYNYSY